MLVNFTNAYLSSNAHFTFTNAYLISNAYFMHISSNTHFIHKFKGVYYYCAISGEIADRTMATDLPTGR